MSQQSFIKIPCARDKGLVRVFRDLHKKYPINSSSGRAANDVSLAALPLSGETKGSWETILKLDSTVIQHLSVGISGMHIYYYRGGRAEPKSAIFDEIGVAYNPQNGELTDIQRLEIFGFLSEKFGAFDPDRTAGTLDSPEFAHAAALHHSTLERLEGLAEAIITRTTETQARLDKNFYEKTARLEEEFELKKAKLASRHQDEENRLSEREAALEQKLREIDNRGNTHARRDIRNNMLDDVKARIENFGVSTSTEKKRKPVLTAMWLLISVLLVLLGAAALEMQEHLKAVSSHAELAAKSIAAKSSVVSSTPASSDVPFYLLWIRLAVLSMGVIGALIYYIRWENRWAEQHANSEFALQQFYVDVNRANWIIESGLEWRKETQSEIPDVILTSVTKNLFNGQDEPDQALHPADELASVLLGTASRLKLRAGNSELEFDKPNKIPK